MNQPAKAQEPSMEEILASIRRIIADDDGGKPQKPEPAPAKAAAAAPPPSKGPVPEPAAMSQDDIDAMLSSFNQAAPTPPPPPEAEPEPSPASPRRAVAAPPSASERSMLSAATSAAVDAAFHSLAQTVLVQNARTLEDLVKEMLRPMLKTWLDDNLPNLVERLVRAEIERVSRGSR